MNDNTPPHGFVARQCWRLACQMVFGAVIIMLAHEGLRALAIWL